MILANACSEETHPSATVGYFDLKSYMQQEIEQVKRAYYGQKTIEVNGRKETQSVNAAHMAEDLLIFAQSDINKPSWRGMYAVDTLTQADAITRVITYIAQKPTMRTQSLTITTHADQVISIHIANKTKARIADAEQTLLYEKGIGYSVINRQKLTLLPESVVNIRTQFVKIK